MSIFKDLNKPFAYDDYRYDKFAKRVYINGQAVAERLNEVLGVGYWKYRPLPETVEVVDTGKIDKNNKQILSVTLMVEFSFWNPDLKEWVTFVDSGSQEMNEKQMGKGDAQKSATTDGMKKCASRLGVASDLYKGMIGTKPQGDSAVVILPASYREYYQSMGWSGVFADGSTQAPAPAPAGTGASAPPAGKELSEKQVARLYSIALTNGYQKSAVEKKVSELGYAEAKMLPKEVYDNLVKAIQDHPKTSGVN